jgi:hypothetical protein
MHPRTIATKVNAYIEKITLHPYKPTTTHRRETTSSSFKWSPSLEGTVLVNVHAAIFSSFRRMGIGILIRDHTGSCLAPCGEHLQEVTLPELAEALALHRVVHFAKDEGFN